MSVEHNYIPSLESLSPSIFRILGCNPGAMTLQGTNTYLLGAKNRKILIDTSSANVPKYMENLERALSEVGENTIIERIICTHWHPDHVGGVPSILAKYGSNIPVHKIPRADKSDEYFPYDYVDDGHIFKTDGVTLRAMFTPGHSDDHMSLYFEEENAVFSGDCILGVGTTTFEDLTSYMKSLKKLLEIRPTIIYPGHGPVIKNGVERIRQYIRHRNRCETAILETLENLTADDWGQSQSSISVPEIVRRLYKDILDHPSLVRGAEKNVKNHLVKLEKENRVVQDCHGWRLLTAKL